MHTHNFVESAGGEGSCLKKGKKVFSWEAQQVGPSLLCNVQFQRVPPRLLPPLRTHSSKEELEDKGKVRERERDIKREILLSEDLLLLSLFLSFPKHVRSHTVLFCTWKEGILYEYIT